MKLNSPLLPIFLVVFIDVLGFAIMLPILPFYSQAFGATPLQVGLLVSAFGLCQLISGPVLGQISDRVGRKPVLLVSQVGTFAGFLTLAFANSLWLVYLGRIVDGLTAGNIVVAQAYVSDVTAPENRARAFGVIGASFGLGFLAGPAISGRLAEYGTHAPLFAASALSALSVLASAAFLPNAGPPPRRGPPQPLQFGFMRLSDFLRDPKTTPHLLSFAAFCAAFALYTSGFALFAERRLFWGERPFGAREVSGAFAYAGFLSLVVQAGLIGRLSARFGERRLAQVGFASVALAYLFLARATGGVPLFAAIALNSVGSSLLRPAITSLISRDAPKDRQGEALGVSQSLISISQIAMPIAAGLFIERGWLAAWALFGAAIALLGLIPAFRGEAPVVSE